MARYTLGPGGMLIMAGANHAWQSPYDEYCIFATITVDATSDG
jgi:hypothetical protein